jgi:hypothetical protein
MQPQHAPAAASVPNVPYPSLVTDVLPSLREMEHFLETMQDAMERVPVWSTATANHEPLLHTLSEVRGKVSEWRRSLTQSLQSKWMAATSEYNAYRHQVDVVLRRRHMCEVQFLFPALKNAERESQLDPTSVMMMSEEEREVRQHLAALGFGYEKSAEGAARRVTKLVKRQEKERAVFDATVHYHGDQLAAAKKRDIQKLSKEMERADQLLQNVVASVEGKIAAAARMQSSTLYHSGSPRKVGQTSPPRTTSARAPTAPASSSLAAAPPVGGRHAGSARSDRSNTTQLHSIQPHRPNHQV